jgi:hypothetical protein
VNTDATLARRMDTHRAACADLENDPLIRAAFDKPAPIAPMATPTQEGALLRRQAS